MRLALVLVLVAAPVTSTWASPTGRFGDAGTISPSGAISVSQSTSPLNSTSILVAPSVFYFVWDGIAVGGGIAVSYRSSSFGSATAFAVTPGLGYNLRLGDTISLFPNASVSWIAPSGGAPSNTGLSIAAPLLGHFGNFFVGAGPYISSPGTTFGLTTVTGGWF